MGAEPGRVLAIIPASGGSKGIPHKNLQTIAGRSLVEHSVRQAVSASSVHSVLVSTDDDDIAEISRVAGAAVVRRPDELSGDTASSEAALLHALDHDAQLGNERPELIVFLQATSPLRTPSHIDEAVATLREQKADSLFSANELHAFVWSDRGGALESVTYDFADRRRRQDFDETHWVENGSIYVCRTEILTETGNRLGGEITVYPMDELSSLQIDDHSELRMARQLWTLGLWTDDAPIGDVEFVVFDFDGVFTDNRVQVDQDGVESVVCDRSDSVGIDRLKAAGIGVAILSTDVNPLVRVRGDKLGVPVVHGSSDKAADLRRLADDAGVSLDRVAFVGNDHNDLPALSVAGTPICVADAALEVRLACRHVTSRPGGRGAVREVADRILAAAG